MTQTGSSTTELSVLREDTCLITLISCKYWLDISWILHHLYDAIAFILINIKRENVYTLITILKSQGVQYTRYNVLL